jgi:2,5-diamino-6-(ribosylamino)-4(3H)-pyrimidinone 5'-phosphate reductase
MLPHVIMHNGTSLDGRMDWYTGDVGLYYELAARWPVDAILTSSNTALAGYAAQDVPEEDAEGYEPPQRRPDDLRPLLVIVDSRGQVRYWQRIRQEPYWRDAIALCSYATPKTYLSYLQDRQVAYILAGDDHVDLRLALQELNASYQVNVVRVDSGGILNGALLRAGLVDEVSVLVNPCLVGGTTPRSIFTAPDLTSSEGVIPLKLIHVENMRGDSVWLRYEVVKR